MDTLNTGFIWEYDDNSFEEKNLLVDSLPEGFKYRVKKLKIIEKSDVKEEVKFQTQIQVNICDKDEAEKFIQMIKNKNDTDMKPTRKEFQRKGFRSQLFNCSIQRGSDHGWQPAHPERAEDTQFLNMRWQQSAWS